MPRKSWTASLIGALSIALAVGFLGAQERQQQQPERTQPQVQPERPAEERERERPTPERPREIQSQRASEIIGMNVRNPRDEDLGRIDDMMVDVRNGEIQYVALAHGGFLGIGETLVAVPWEQLQFQRENDETFILLDIPRERLEQARGFDDDDWPDPNDPEFRRQQQELFGPEAREPREERRPQERQPRQP